MVVLLSVVGVFAVAFFTYAIVLRHRDAVARRAWEMYCNEQALANDAARAARRAALRTEAHAGAVTVEA